MTDKCNLLKYFSESVKIKAVLVTHRLYVLKSNTNKIAKST